MSGEDPLVEVNAMGLFLIGQRCGAIESLWLSQPPSLEKVFPYWRDFVGALHLFLNAPFVPDGLGRARTSAEELRVWCLDLEKTYKVLWDEGNIQSFAAPFPPETVHGLMMRLDSFRTHLDGDVKDLTLFYVPQRLGYNTRTLLEDGARLFGRHQARIEQIAGRDVAEACRCFALGAWTASSFHILRACELVMIDYCDACNQVVNTETGTWAGYLAALGHVRDLPPRFRGRVTRLKDYDRNEIMHPRRFVDDHEAATIFDFVKAAMMEMIDDSNIRRSSTQKVDDK